MATGLDDSPTLPLGEINKYDFRTDTPAVFKARKGIDATIVSQISEMKRAEILQLAMLRPKFAVLDETDSGLDADAVRLASQSIARIGGADMGILIITHHEQLLEHNTPLKTHVMLGGRIVESGGPELAVELHKRGYERIRAAYPDAAAAERAMDDRKTTAREPVTA